MRLIGRPDKQGLAHVNNDIEAEGSSAGHQSSQLGRAVDLIVTMAIQAGLFRSEGTDVQRDDRFGLRF